MAKVFLHWYSSAELHLAIENLGKLGNHGQGNIAKENMLGKIMGKKIIAKVMIIDKIWVYVAKVISFLGRKKTLRPPFLSKTSCPLF